METKKTMISGCVIAQDCASVIVTAIADLKQFADEVVVVDGGSKDETVKVSEKAGAKVFFRKWSDDFSAQRNFGTLKAKGEWIFMLDSDERVTPELAKRIKELILTKNKEIIGFYIPRLNYIDSKLVSSSAKRETLPRLFRRSQKYIGIVHEKPKNFDRFEKPKFSPSEYIIHAKDAKTQRAHLLFQKDLIEKDLEKAKREKNKAGIERMQRILDRWDIWWKDANR